VTGVAGAALYNNKIVGNRISGSGLAGVTVQSHMTGQNFSGNVIASDNIGTNNLLGDFQDTVTTGVYVGSVEPLIITVVGNGTAVTVVRPGANSDFNVGVRLATYPGTCTG
jgi:hypothetical protein